MANTRKDGKAVVDEKVSVKTPANIIRKMIGSKWYKLDRDYVPEEDIENPFTELEVGMADGTIKT